MEECAPFWVEDIFNFDMPSPVELVLIALLKELVGQVHVEVGGHRADKAASELFPSGFSYWSLSEDRSMIFQGPSPNLIPHPKPGTPSFWSRRTGRNPRSG